MASCTEYISTCMPENTRRHTQSELCSLKHEPDDLWRMGLTIVELAVGLLTVDDVEAVVGPHAHTAHLKIEPLVVVITVNI